MSSREVKKRWNRWCKATVSGSRDAKRPAEQRTPPARHRKKSGLKRCRRYENQRSGRKRVAGKPEPLQESREFGGRPAVHVASDEHYGSGRTKFKHVGGETLRKKGEGMRFVFVPRLPLPLDKGGEVNIAA